MKSMYQMIKDGDVIFRPSMTDEEVVQVFLAVRDDPAALYRLMDESTPEERRVIFDYIQTPGTVQSDQYVLL